MGAGIGAPRVAGDATDQELVQACRSGDERAWSLLVDRFSRYVYAIVAQAYRLPEHDSCTVVGPVRPPNMILT